VFPIHPHGKGKTKDRRDRELLPGQRERGRAPCSNFVHSLGKKKGKERPPFSDCKKRGEDLNNNQLIIEKKGRKGCPSLRKPAVDFFKQQGKEGEKKHPFKLEKRGIHLLGQSVPPSPKKEEGREKKGSTNGTWAVINDTKGPIHLPQIHRAKKKKNFSSLNEKGKAALFPHEGKEKTSLFFNKNSP